jgi:hypothetical protein
MSIIAKIRALITLGQGMSKGISELTADKNPITLFGNWFDRHRYKGWLPVGAHDVAEGLR